MLCLKRRIQMAYGYEEKSKYNGYFPFSAEYSDHPARMNAHWHSRIELMFFYSTSGCRYNCRGKNFDIQSGDLIIANSAELHECADFGKSEVCCITAAPDILAKYKGVRFRNHIRGDIRIAAVFDRLKSAFGDKTFEFLLASCVYEIFAILISDYICDNISERKKNGYNISYDIINEIMLYIENNLSEKLTADRLAARANLSPGRFFHVFKEVAGASPAEYIEKMRLSHAVCLLSNDAADISEIACECGFTDHSYFSHRFKKHFGCTPKEFRSKTPETEN